jgi:hypothetical protein
VPSLAYAGFTGPVVAVLDGEIIEVLRTTRLNASG